MVSFAARPGSTLVAPAAAASVTVAMAVVIVWGATPTATTMALQSLEPEMAAAMRTGLAGMVALPLALMMRLRPPRGRGQWSMLFFSGLAAFVIFPLMLALGLERTSASHAALIIAVGPIATGVIGAALDRRWPVGRWWLGVVIAMVGEYVLIADENSAAGGGDAIGDLICVTAMVFVAMSYVAGSRLSHQMGTWSVTFWGVIVASVPSLTFVMVKAIADGWPDASTQSLLAIVFLAVITTILGYAGWFWALANGGIARIAPLQFLVPVIGVVLAVMLLSDPVTPQLLIAGVAIIGGIVIASWSRNVRQ